MACGRQCPSMVRGGRLQMQTRAASLQDFGGGDRGSQLHTVVICFATAPNDNLRHHHLQEREHCAAHETRHEEAPFLESAD